MLFGRARHLSSIGAGWIPSAVNLGSNRVNCDGVDLATGGDRLYFVITLARHA